MNLPSSQKNFSKVFTDISNLTLTMFHVARTIFILRLFEKVFTTMLNLAFSDPVYIGKSMKPYIDGSSREFFLVYVKIFREMKIDV